MKPKINLRFIFSAAIALVAAYALYSSYSWPFRSALFPRIIAIPLLCLALAEMALGLFGTERERQGYAVDFEMTKEVDPVLARRRTLAIYGWSVGFFAIILSVGFPLGVPLFVFLYLKLAGREGWAMTGVLTLLSWLFMEGLFDQLLHIPFPEGWIFSLLQ